MSNNGISKHKMADFVKVLISVVIFGALIGTIANSLASAANNTELSTAAQTILGLGGLFVAIGFLYYIGKMVGVRTR